MPETQEWFDLPDYRGHEVSIHGQVRNKSNGRLMGTSTNQTGTRYVTMRNTTLGKTENKSLAALMAEIFCPYQGEITLWGGVNDTVLRRDGDQENVAASNLVWAPRWFAIAFHQQVNDPKWNQRKRIVDGNHKIYRSYAHAASETVALPNAIEYAVRYNDGLSGDESSNLVHTVAGGHIFRSL
jgi:hypothetical protein